MDVYEKGNSSLFVESYLAYLLSRLVLGSLKYMYGIKMNVIGVKDMMECGRYIVWYGRKE